MRRLGQGPEHRSAGGHGTLVAEASPGHRLPFGLTSRGRGRFPGLFLSEPVLDFQYIDAQLPPESPYLYGLHPNAEIGFLTQTSEKLFRTVLELQPRDSRAGDGAGATREEKVCGGIVRGRCGELRIAEETLVPVASWLDIAVLSTDPTLHPSPPTCPCSLDMPAPPSKSPAHPQSCHRAGHPVASAEVVPLGLAVCSASPPKAHAESVCLPEGRKWWFGKLTLTS